MADKQPDVMAILAMIFAIIFPIVGLILAIIARNKIKKDPKLGGEGLAKAALIVSIVLIAIPILILIIGMIAFFGVMGPTAMVP